VAGDEVDQCALARAVGPDDIEDLRLAEAEGDVVDGREPAEAAAELLDLEDRGHSRYARIVSSRDIRRWAHESRANETIPIGSSTTANEEVADALRRSDTPKIDRLSASWRFEHSGRQIEERSRSGGIPGRMRHTTSTTTPSARVTIGR